MAKPLGVDITVPSEGDTIGGGTWRDKMCELVHENAPPQCNLRDFDKRMFAWEPLKNAIRSRRAELNVTIEQLCDYFHLTRELMRATLRRATNRYDDITILVMNELDANELRSPFNPDLRVALGHITMVTFLIDYDDVDDLADETERRRAYDSEDPPPKRCRTEERL